MKQSGSLQNPSKTGSRNRGLLGLFVAVHADEFHVIELPVDEQLRGPLPMLGRCPSRFRADPALLPSRVSTS
jgi:hypothetical protein